MTRNRLAHNLAVVFRHLEEVGNLHRTLFGLLRSPNRSGSAQTFKRVKQKCLHFYFRATCLEFAQCPRKRGRCSRFASLSGESLRGSREICLLWAFPALSCGSGYILWVTRFTPFPPNLIKRSLAPINNNTRLPRVSTPRGHYP